MSKIFIDLTCDDENDVLKKSEDEVQCVGFTMAKKNPKFFNLLELENEPPSKKAKYGVIVEPSVLSSGK